MGKKKESDFDQMVDALFAGSMATQAVPMLSKAGRTTAALTRTATGFVGIGVTGAVAKTAFGMVRASQPLTKKKRKRKGR